MSGAALRVQLMAPHGWVGQPCWACGYARQPCTPPGGTWAREEECKRNGHCQFARTEQVVRCVVATPRRGTTNQECVADFSG